VNSNEQEILRANHFFRGVQLPAGGHRVKFVYDPVSFKIGLLVSLVTTMLLIAVPLANRMVRRVALSGRKDARAPASLSRSPEGAEPAALVQSLDLNARNRSRL
jgi:hypothetical protein